jgi:hypothetical protein
MQTAWAACLFAIPTMASTCGASPQLTAWSKPQIESGFNLLYTLRFAEARDRFADWQRTNPGDPVGYAAMAAGYLSEEFYYKRWTTISAFLSRVTRCSGTWGLRYVIPCSLRACH